MKFFDRKSEIAALREIRAKSEVNAQFTVVTGRRRVGKTQLIKAAMGDSPYLYFYVGRKSEKVLCSGYQQQMHEVLGVPTIGTAEQVEDVKEGYQLAAISTGGETIPCDPAIGQFTYRFVDVLVTNFHQPESTLILLVSAFVKGDWHTIYDYALANGYRFLSYGDSSLLRRVD